VIFGYEVNKLKAFQVFAKSLAVAAYKSADVRDFLVFGGLFCLGYGLYQLRPWLGLASFGAVSMLLGLGWIVRRPK
jgi:hypothetical protein